jgi:hypothetical protein
MKKIGNYCHLITCIDFLRGQIAMLLNRAEEMDNRGGDSSMLRANCLELSTGIDVLESVLRENSTEAIKYSSEEEAELIIKHFSPGGGLEHLIDFVEVGLGEDVKEILKKKGFIK